MDLGQKENGLYKFLDFAHVYILVQFIFGGAKSRKSFVDTNIKLSPGSVVLDIGSGTSDIIDYLPRCDYHGFEPAKKYHLRAKRQHGSKGKFYNAFFDKQSSKSLPKFDLVLLQGVMHHMNDDELSRNLKLIRASMSRNGQLITIDPVFHRRQNIFSRMLVSLDRGNHVRTDEQYKKILTGIFEQTNGRVQTKSFVPYSHFISICR